VPDMSQKPRRAPFGDGGTRDGPWVSARLSGRLPDVAALGLVGDDMVAGSDKD
jgi:hypothetical protein